MNIDWDRVALEFEQRYIKVLRADNLTLRVENAELDMGNGVLIDRIAALEATNAKRELALDSVIEIVQSEEKGTPEENDLLYMAIRGTLDLYDLR